MAIAWKDEYCTTEETIDAQHQQLFDFVNKLETLIANGTVDGPEVEKLLRFLENYVKLHFSFEEICMMRKKCPVAKQNKEAHVKFLALFGRFKEDYTQNGGSAELLQRLYLATSDWLVVHICKIDLNLRACL